MAKYLIPLSNVDELTKKINRIRNKGATVTFVMGKEKLVDVTIHVVDGSSGIMSPRVIKVMVVEFEIEGRYEINGWRFVGTIQHSEVGNIVRQFDTSLEGKVPEKYRTVGPACEHCNRIRDRKDTYLIYNEKSSQFKQVGKTCLMDFTGGLDAEVCAQISTALKNAEDSEKYGDAKSDFFNGVNRASLLTKDVKPLAYGYVKEHGYVSRETGRVLAKYLFGDSNGLVIIPATDEEVSKMDEWVNNKKPNSDYMENAKVAWFKESCEYRDMALVTSLVSTYLRESEMEKKLSSVGGNEFSGVVGKNVTINNPQSIRVLYVKSGSRYSRNAPDTNVYSIVGDDGKTYIWSTTADGLINNVDSIESITGVVKSHTIYNGVKQTVITRCKVSYKNQKESSPTSSSSNGLQSFFDLLKDIED